MKHNIGDDHGLRSSRQQASHSSTVVFVTADELERRTAFAAEIDRIQRRLGPVELSAVELIEQPAHTISRTIVILSSRLPASGAPPAVAVSSFSRTEASRRFGGTPTQPGQLLSQPQRVTWSRSADALDRITDDTDESEEADEAQAV